MNRSVSVPNTKKADLPKPLKDDQSLLIIKSLVKLLNQSEKHKNDS